MDTEAFLLNRDRIVQRLAAKRAAHRLERAGAQSFMGLSWGSWAKLLAGGMQTGFVSRSLLQFVVPTLLPALIAYGRSKTSGFSARNGIWSKLTDVLSFLSPKGR